MAINIISTTCPDANIINSGSTYSGSAPAGHTFILPNITNIDSNGSSVLTPAQVAFTATTCDPATIINSGSTYTASTAAGSTFQLPNITNINSNGSSVLTPAMVAFTATTCDPATIINSGSTYTASTAAGSTFQLPNITNINSNGSSVLTPAMVGFTASTCNFSATTIINSGSTYSGYSSGGTFQLPNITHIDSNLSGVTLPAQTPFTATTCGTISDPPSFDDAVGLFLGNRGLTFVDGELDDWANQGTGNDAVASAAANRIGVNSASGVGGYRNFQPWNMVNFGGGGHGTSALSAYTFEGVSTMWAAWNPGRFIPSLGNVNSSNYAGICWIGSQGFRLTIRTSSSNVDTYWSRANMGINYGEPFAWTIVYDGSQGTNTDRLKLYVNGVLKSQSTTPTIPSTVTPDGTIKITSTHTNYSSYAEIGGYVGFWDRILTSTELSANQTWREQIWAVAP